ncbi:MAG TPA: FtsX-like permease family protein [Prosthecobacter sp.]|nr:FtsX-like permease family protein [Prosthecobacter sp.]
MASKVSVFLALRYLKPRRSFVSVITLISILGIMLGVGVLVVVMAIFKGFQTEFRNLLLGFEPHLVLVQHVPRPGEIPPGFEAPPQSNWRDVLAAVQRQPGVLSALPMAEGVAVIRAGESDPEGVELFGLKPGADNPLLRKLEKHRLEGDFDLNDENIIITDRVARKLKVGVGGVVEVYAAENIRQMIREVRAIEEEDKPAEAYEEVTVIPKDLTVKAIVRADTAGERCYAPLFVAQELFQLEDAVTGLEVEVADPDAVEMLANRLRVQGVLPPDWGGRTWRSQHETLMASVENQKSLLYFLLVFIMLVAAICVMNTTITVTVQKRREIGVLTALGAPARQVIAIFLTQASVVAVCGIVTGIISGVVMLQVLNPLRQFLAWLFKIDIFPQEVYFLSRIPSEVDMMDVTYVCQLAVSLCLLAALIPAWFAARVDPAVALRD